MLMQIGQSVCVRLSDGIFLFRVLAATAAQPNMAENLSNHSSSIPSGPIVPPVVITVDAGSLLQPPKGSPKIKDIIPDDLCEAVSICVVKKTGPPPSALFYGGASAV